MGVAGIKLTPRHYAYLKISEGCNHRCTFCIIPSMRGDLVSRPVGDVLSEARALFEGGVIAHAGEDIASAQYVELFNQVPPLRELVVAAVGNTESVAQIASGVEFVLEGLHLSKRLNKDESGSRATYRSRT
jgi:hypothetical protein